MKWLDDRALRRLQEVIDFPDPGATRYELCESVGSGGMASVHRAYDRELDREVAVKVLKTAVVDASMQRRLRQEAGILASLEHPGIVPVHDVGRLADGRLYYVMKLVRGQRLDEVAKAGAGLHEKLRIFQRICEAVAFAHSRGVIHRDLKPENVMVGGFGEVLVLDWGLAKLLQEAEAGNAMAIRKQEDSTSEEGSPSPAAAGAASDERESSSVTAHGTVLGTPRYMSPEQERGDVERVDRRSDVFALGGILHFLLTLRAPESSAPMVAGSSGDAGPSLPRALRAIRDRARAADPGSRYVDVPALMADVANYLAQLPVSADPENWLRRLARLADKHRTALLLIFGYVVVRLTILFVRGI